MFFLTREARMLYLVGLGLGDIRDITVKGLETVKRCSRVYLESYTSMLCYGLEKAKLEQFYGKELNVADREFVESDSDDMLDQAANQDVAFLVVGDPFGATTHCDLMLRAKQRNIEVKVIHNASIMNAIGCCGLQLYNFGETVSIVFWTDDWQPDSYFDKIVANRQRGLHTLCLLDIKVKEQTIENMIKNKKIYEPPRFMTARQAADQLLTIARRRRASGIETGIDDSTQCVGLARVGWDNQRILACPMGQMSTGGDELGDPLHSLIVTGKLHPIEEDMLKLWTPSSGISES